MAAVSHPHRRHLVDLQEWQNHPGQACPTPTAAQQHLIATHISPSSPDKWHHHSHYHCDTSPSSSQAIPGVAIARATPASALLQSSWLQSAHTHSRQRVAVSMSHPGCGAADAYNEDAKKEQPLKQASICTGHCIRTPHPGLAHYRCHDATRKSYT